MKSVLADPRAYDWQGDAPLNRPWARTIIYEMHVRGFTAHPSSGLSESKRGTYAGLIEKIPYLQQLGITAVELLPVFQFDPQDAPPGRTNFWGYSPVSFFAPHQAYSSRQDPLAALDEFRDMVKALHRAGIEVILDVVFNHTAEDGHDGPTQCFRGLDNPTYYLLCEDPSRYANFTGTGNTLNTNHPVTRRMIVDSLRYWVTEMHVDGFRFDLASVLARDSSGTVMSNPPVLWDIESDPALAGTKMIAEAWDAAGLYQVGSFVGDSWKEWNDHFRDDVRDFFRGANDSVARMADRLLGSPSIYAKRGREAEESINFVACHDGFTLNDVVTYNHKHNHENGENNRDGHEDNRSWNSGCEGPADDPEIEKLRNRQVKNLFTATILSVGVPMFVMGDEVRRSQRGNNNAYCQDNDTSWLDWTLLSQHADVHRFVKLLIERRVIRDLEHEHRRVSLAQVLRESKRALHGVAPQSTRLVDALAQLRDQRGIKEREAVCPHHIQCVLGASGLRTSRFGGRAPELVAMDRHSTRSAARDLRMEWGNACAGDNVSRWRAFSGGADRGRGGEWAWRSIAQTEGDSRSLLRTGASFLSRDRGHHRLTPLGVVEFARFTTEAAVDVAWRCYLLRHPPTVLRWKRHDSLRGR